MAKGPMWLAGEGRGTTIVLPTTMDLNVTPDAGTRAKANGRPWKFFQEGQKI